MFAFANQRRTGRERLWPPRVTLDERSRASDATEVAESVSSAATGVAQAVAPRGPSRAGPRARGEGPPAGPRPFVSSLRCGLTRFVDGKDQANGSLGLRVEAALGVWVMWPSEAVGGGEALLARLAWRARAVVLSARPLRPPPRCHRRGGQAAPAPPPRAPRKQRSCRRARRVYSARGFRGMGGKREAARR
ncbi:unnamed protein product [Lampetra fluviatilis]